MSCLEENICWDLLLLQELSRAGEDWAQHAEGSLGGHMLVTNPAKSRDTAVLVHRRFVGKVAAINSCDHAVSVTVRCGAKKVQ